MTIAQACGSSRDMAMSPLCIMQVFGASEAASTLMLHVYNGALHYYNKQLVEDNIYNRWFKLNVVHDVESSKLTYCVYR
jgi:hypothetical protein